MSFFFTSLFIHLKKMLLTPFFFCTAALIAALVIMCGYLFKNDNTITVNVGILAEKPDTLTNGAAAELLANEQINFTVFDSEERGEMIEMVKNRSLECAYIFREGIYENIMRERLDNNIIIIVSPATTASPIVNEIVHAAVMKASAADFAARITAEMFGVSEEPLTELFKEQIAGYYEDDIFVKPIYIRENEYSPEVTNLFATRIMRGCVLSLLFVFAYFLLPGLISEKNSGVYKMLNLPKMFSYYLSQFVSAYAAQFALFTGALILIHIAAPEAGAGFMRELKLAALYTAAITAVVMLAALLFKSAEPLYSAFIFAFLFQIMFGNTYVNIREFSSALGSLTVLPSAYYMEYLLYQTGLTVLAGVFAAGVTCSCVIVYSMGRK